MSNADDGSADDGSADEDTAGDAGSDDTTGGMRLDLVSQPARYPRTPLLALLLVAILPALGLVALFYWSDDRADSYDVARELESGAELEVTTATVPEDGREATELDVELFSYRRAPEPIALVAAVNRLAEAVEPVFTFVSSDSCAAIAVDGIAVAAINPDLPVIPASNQKLLTAAVALELLGPDHRFVTSVRSAPIVDGVVAGDLALIGGGDPLLTADDFPIDEDRYPAFNTTSLDRLADAVVAAGVVAVDGAVIGDGTRYDDEFVVEGWGEGVAFVDAGPYDALMVNDARELGGGGVENDPNDAAADEFERLLEDRGVTVGGGSTAGIADPAATEIASIESAPLVDVLAEMLTTSDNNTAELMVKEIGFADSGEGSRAAGLNAIDRTLRGWDVPMDGVRFFDGSGLHPSNRVTCAALVAVLERMRTTPLPGALPVAAQTGTLAEEFIGHPVAGRMRAKTGTLNNEPFDEDPPAVKALAGYLDPPVSPGDEGADSAGTVEFALVLNTPDVTLDDKFRPLWEALGERLATFPDGPTAQDLAPLP